MQILSQDFSMILSVLQGLYLSKLKRIETDKKDFFKKIPGLLSNLPVFQDKGHPFICLKIIYLKYPINFKNRTSVKNQSCQS